MLLENTKAIKLQTFELCLQRKQSFYWDSELVSHDILAFDKAVLSLYWLSVLDTLHKAVVCNVSLKHSFFSRQTYSLKQHHHEDI